MNAVFADTTYYVALNSRRDAGHPRAVAWLSTSAAFIYTTEFVQLEVANFFKQPGNRGNFVTFHHRLTTDPTTSIVPLSSELMKRGIALFAARPDKDWSLTDCISFVVMQDNGIKEALTSDHHFEQAGFTALLK